LFVKQVPQKDAALKPNDAGTWIDKNAEEDGNADGYACGGCEEADREA
jgi:hypothetical protein